MSMLTQYFTFGGNHNNDLFGLDLTSGTTLAVTAICPRDVMHRLFGNKWSHCYDTLSDVARSDKYKIIRLTIESM